MKKPTRITFNGNIIKIAKENRTAWRMDALSPSMTKPPTSAVPFIAVLGPGTPPSPVAWTMFIWKCPVFRQLALLQLKGLRFAKYHSRDDAVKAQRASWT